MRVGEEERQIDRLIDRERERQRGEGEEVRKKERERDRQTEGQTLGQRKIDTEKDKKRWEPGGRPEKQNFNALEMK